MLTDRNGNPLCGWCGCRMPDYRLGHETCGGVCEAELAQDRRRAAEEWREQRHERTKARKRASMSRRREAARAHGVCFRCRQPNPTPERSHCPQCRAVANEAVKRHRATVRQQIDSRIADGEFGTDGQQTAALGRLALRRLGFWHCG